LNKFHLKYEVFGTKKVLFRDNSFTFKPNT
jgi:hypothetical protein